MSRRSFGGRGRGRGKRGRDRDDAGGSGAAGDDREDAYAGGPLRQREAYMRMNFLYQAAHLTATGPAACLPLSRFYAATMRKIGTRLTIRSSPHAKSDTCKVCYSLLTPTPPAAVVAGGGSVVAGGVVLDLTQMGSSVALQSSTPSAEAALIRTCRCCRTQRRVGLKRHARRKVAVAAGSGVEQAKECSEPVQLPQNQPTTTSSAPEPVDHAVTTAPMSTDADGMR